MISFPELNTALEHQLKKFDAKRLTAAAAEISAHYRRGDIGKLRFSSEHHAAYAATRMPATFSVVKKVLEEITSRKPEAQIETLLDIGSGPGTVAWAASSLFNLRESTLMERDRGFVEFGKALAADSANKKIIEAHWQIHDLKKPVDLTSHDLVVASYSLGELDGIDRRRLVSQCGKSAQQAFVVIEPGTPAGYAVILDIRNQLIAEGLTILAPCPHHAACPMVGQDWCHFAKRLERSPFHRLIKDAQLGYEDEKYSYIIATHEPMQHYTSRVVRRPMIRSGHIYLDCCTENGIKREIVTRSDKEKMRRAKKTEWGDVWM